MKFVFRRDRGVGFVSETLWPFCETLCPTEAGLRIVRQQESLDTEESQEFLLNSPHHPSPPIILQCTVYPWERKQKRFSSLSRPSWFPLHGGPPAPPHSSDTLTLLPGVKLSRAQHRTPTVLKTTTVTTINIDFSTAIHFNLVQFD